MNILYLSISYVPSRRASSVQVMKMCDAMARAGHTVSLVTKDCPPRQEAEVEDVYQFYAIQPLFEIVRLPRPVQKGGGFVYLFHIAYLLGRRRGQTDLVFSRDLVGACIAAWMGHRVLFEAHGLPMGRSAQYLFRQLLNHPRLKRLVVISEALKELHDQHQWRPRHGDVVVAHDGATADALASRPPASKHDAFEVGYIGNLYAGRGMELILDLARKLKTCQFHIVGGSEKDLAAWGQHDLPENLTLHGFVAPGELSFYYQRFDVLLMPYQKRVVVASGKTDTSRWMSPLKMFEYMAAGKPIISSDLPVLREVLRHEENALLVPPADVAAWTDAIKRLRLDRGFALRLGQMARRDLEAHYTWDARTKVVLHGL